MFPVGLTQPLGVSSPVVGANGKVVGFLSASETSNGRRFPVDLSGFSVGLSVVRNQSYKTDFEAKFRCRVVWSKIIWPTDIWSKHAELKVTY